MEFKDLIIEEKDNLAIITINRPKVLNALNAETIRQLSLAFANYEKSDTVQIIILTGSGDKSFVAGADIAELLELDTRSSLSLAKRGQNLMQQIEEHTLPVIAAINGFALGGGCELALACDIRLAIETAKMGLPEVSLGLIPGYGGTQRLPRLIGRGRAKQLIFTGEHISAQQAYDLGIVDQVISGDWIEITQDDGSVKKKPDGETNRKKLLDCAIDLAQKILKNGPLAVQAAKRAINHGVEMSLTEGCIYESALFSGLYSTEDTKEGLKAFLEKRKANFKAS